MGKQTELLRELSDVCLRRFKAVDMSDRVAFILDELVAQQCAKHIVQDEQLFENLLHTMVPNHGFKALKVCQVWNVALREDLVPTPALTEIYINWLNRVYEQKTDMFSSDCLRSLAITLSLTNSKTLKATVNLLQPSSALFCSLSNISEGKICEDTILSLEVLKSYCHFTSEEPMEKSFQPLVAQCFKTFVTVLENSQLNESDPLTAKALLACLQGLNNIYARFSSSYTLQCSSVLGLAKAYSFFVLPGHSLQLTMLRPCSIGFPTYVVPENDKGLMPKATCRKKRGQKPRKTRKEDEEDSEDEGKDAIAKPTSTPMKSRWTASDSDYSDTEHRNTLRELQYRVRTSALQLLTTLFKNIERRLILSFLTAFLPDSEYPLTSTQESVPSSNGRHLLVHVLKDPSPRVRSAALHALAALLEAARPSLAIAQDLKSESASFISLAQTLSYMCVAVHRSLLLALKAERFPHVLVPLFQCLTIAAGAFPYHKLQSGMLSKLITAVRPWLQHTEITILVASLALLRTITATHPHNPEVLESLTSDLAASVTIFPQYNDVEVGDDGEEEVDPTDLMEGLQIVTNDTSVLQSSVRNSWLLNVCLHGARGNARWKVSTRGPAAYVPLRLESMLVMGDLSKNNFEMVEPYMNEIIGVLCTSLADIEPDVHVRLRAGKVLAMILGAINEQSQKGEYITQGCDIWTRVLRGPLPTVHKDKSGLLRAEACNCLAAMSPSIFDLLQRDVRLMCVTLLLGSTCDTEPTVKAAAIRGVGFYVTFPALLEDSAFLLDAAESIIDLMNDESVAVQSNAAWSLGNLADTIKTLRETCGLPEDFPSVFVVKLLRAGTKAASGNTKVKISGVRALGLLLKVFPFESVEASNDIAAAVTALEKNATSSRVVKNQWNACYAIGNLLKNHSLLSSAPGWLPTLLSSLMDIVERCNNFKVRIAATTALAVPNCRSSYGDNYIKCWKMGFNALGSLQHSDEVGEYQHKEQLIFQVCLLFCRLTKLLASPDLTPLQEVLVVHYDVVMQHMQKFKSNILPEQSSPLLEANEVLGMLSKQRKTATTDILLSVFDLKQS